MNFKNVAQLIEPIFKVTEETLSHVIAGLLFSNETQLFTPDKIIPLPKTQKNSHPRG